MCGIDDRIIGGSGGSVSVLWVCFVDDVLHGFGFGGLHVEIFESFLEEAVVFSSHKVGNAVHHFRVFLLLCNDQAESRFDVVNQFVVEFFGEEIFRSRLAIVGSEPFTKASFGVLVNEVAVFAIEKM